MNRNPSGKIGALLCILLVMGMTMLAFGQGIVTGSLSGTVVDPQGAVIVGAKVTATNTATNQSASDVTNAAGAYSIRQLPPGSYNVSISAPNFQTLNVKAVNVSVGVDTVMGAQKMAVGATTETITVEATAPLVESTTPQLSTTYETKQVTDLPINNAFDELVLLVPGAVTTGDAGFSNTNGAGISMNGQRGRSNNFQIDGQANNDNSVAGPSIFLGNQDVIAEYQVISNNFSAEYGRNMGSVINYITKSGSNSLHGSAFWFYTGSWLSSMANQEKNPLFGICIPPATSASTGGACQDPKVSRYDENRIGGTIGGPIKKNKAWFFGSYQKDYLRFGATPTSSDPNIMPTPAGLATLAGCFPGSPGLDALTTIGPYGVAAGNPTPTGTPVNLNISNGLAVCNNVQFSTFTRFLPAQFNDNEVTGRIDVQVTPKDRFFGRYIYQDNNFTNATGRFAVGAVVDLPARDQQLGLDWVRTFTDHFINQVRFGFSRAGFGFEGGTFPDCTNFNILACPSGVTFSSAGSNVLDASGSLVAVNLPNFGMQNNLPQGRLINVSQWQDNASWVHGRHTIKFGGEYDRQRSPNVFLPNINGTFTVGGNNSATDLNPCAFYTGLLGASTGNTACAFDRLMANDARSLSLTDGPPAFNFKEQDTALYVQDDWRFRDNLTFNFGVRWEWNQQAINLLHDLTVARETGPSPFWDTTLPLAQRTVPAIPQDYNNFGPVVGFAYTPHIWESVFGRDKTVIRGGFRVAYDPEFYNMFLNVATAAPVVNAGSIPTVGLPGGAPTGNSLRAAGYLLLIPTGANPGKRVQTTVSSNFHNPYAEQWNFGIQRELTSKIALEVNYVGNHTVGNFQTINGNPYLGPIGGGVGSGLANDFPALLPAGVTQCATPGQPGFNTRPDCSKTLVRLRDNSASASYHSLQANLRMQNWHGWTSGLSWTWSHAIDNVSEIYSTFGGGNGVAGSMNPFNAGQPERGTSGTSYTHVVTLWWVYELPWYKSQAGFLGKVLGGWQVNGVYQYHSGQPWNPQQFTASVYCDQSFAIQFYSTADTCRPLLGDATAPMGNVGFYDGTCTLQDATGSGATTFHWIYNDTQAALCLGNPYLGVGRNILRGDTFNNVDVGLYKNFKMGERVTMQAQVNAYNILNRQFRAVGVESGTPGGVPDPFLDDGIIGLGTQLNTNGSYAPGAGQRRFFTFGLKFIF